MEVFKPIPDFPDYEISNLGVLRKTNGTILVDEENPRDRINIVKDKKPYGTTVAKLVLTAFDVEKNNEKDCPIHIDGNRTNNRLDNLRYGSAGIVKSRGVYNAKATHIEAKEKMQKYGI